MKNRVFLILAFCTNFFLHVVFAQQPVYTKDVELDFHEKMLHKEGEIFSPSIPIESNSADSKNQKMSEMTKHEFGKIESKEFSTSQNFFQIFPDTVIADTTKIEPKLHPLIPSGAGVFAAGVALTTVSVLSGTLSIFIGIAAIIAGILLVNWGYKKVKADPKKWKGEKLTLAVYYALIPVGLFLMLYPVYLLFVL